MFVLKKNGREKQRSLSFFGVTVTLKNHTEGWDVASLFSSTRLESILLERSNNSLRESTCSYEIFIDAFVIHV